ncbi:type II toxin-antitoxin system VapC family toxin [Agrobacterium larrymoorei]|uniref:Ribonuclease VapC n=1 Tax=Agrobacterium larrymoorei TaxID=160699 RepID=A0A2Z2Q4M6_9HYPH|nr:type II toxin-antitoxin system VapC family toxin [Agrobacterium larrymoorei]ASK49471.1 PIN domain-containing protein [Agrobacterium larrymoorei]QCI99266.1 type II toxin-antitoxin system VapC family toxin [Agrobacterium larrymoorei]QYA08802.1 type II toxin-antitoxin system VapC family toxin [Agrobacterium larrymoorei]
MILIDTNVISEPLKPAPYAAVLTWLDAQAIETLFISAISIAERRFGIASMPRGKRQMILHGRLEDEVLPIFEKRILPFNVGTSQFYANLMASGRASGKVIGKADRYTAATAAEHDLAVATRDASPFEAAGLRVINPWATWTFKITGLEFEPHQSVG